MGDQDDDDDDAKNGGSCLKTGGERVVVVAAAVIISECHQSGDGGVYARIVIRCNWKARRVSIRRLAEGLFPQ
jgi:hypothetical protein